jgi:hypothetical protein
VIGKKTILCLSYTEHVEVSDSGPNFLVLPNKLYLKKTNLNNLLDAVLFLIVILHINIIS